MVLNMLLLLLVIDLEKIIKSLIQELFMNLEILMLKYSKDLLNGNIKPMLKENLKLYAKNLKLILKMIKKLDLLPYSIKNTSKKVILD